MAGLMRLSLEEIISIVIAVIAFIIVGYIAIKYLGFGFSDIPTE